MLTIFKKLFGIEEKDEPACPYKMEPANPEEDLRKRLDSMTRMYDTLSEEYEDLSRRYFALKLTDPDEYPGTRDVFAPKCVRKNPDTCSFFRMRSHSYIPAFKKFLRNSGHWTRDDDPDVRNGHTENGEPLAWFENEKFIRIEIPYGCVMLVFDRSPKTAWLIITEEKFNKDWLVVD